MIKGKEISDAKEMMRRILYERRNILIDYLKMKVQSEDWHAVRDAAVDIEVIDAKLEILE